MILGLWCITVVAQNRYEGFEVDRKFGIMDIQTMETFKEPSYENWDKMFTDAVVLSNGPEYTFFSRTTGKTETYSSAVGMCYFNADLYRFFLKNNKSVAIPSKTAKKIVLPKRYDSATGDGSNLYVITNGMYDVFKRPDFKKPKLLNIEASKLFTGLLYGVREDKELFVAVFYGGAHIYVYDGSLKLLNTYVAQTDSEEQVFRIISADFTKIEKEALPSDYATIPRYWVMEYKDGYTKVSSLKYGRSFSVKGEYSNGVMWDEQDWVSITERETGRQYGFKVDFENRKFGLPKKYQSVLELGFL